MARTKSRSSHSAVSRKSRSTRSNGTRRANRSEDGTQIRRYLDFIRAIVGPSRNGR
ncbi:MAG TPA: hypothetical protein VFS09_03915 [Candidatus Eisenbacteria bacterium]|nr:hypothetical protein [Candidatus Eisenbacteria bacterium]